MFGRHAAIRICFPGKVQQSRDIHLHVRALNEAAVMWLEEMQCGGGGDDDDQSRTHLLSEVAAFGKVRNKSKHFLCFVGVRPHWVSDSFDSRAYLAEYCRADIRKAWAWLEDGVKELKHSILALYYAAHDPRTGWLPRLAALAYALSPLDLIPDFIPVLGFLDDLILLPGLIWLGIKLIPVEVCADAKERADVEPLRLNENWIAATMIFVLWDCIALYVTWAISRHFGNAYLLAHIWIPLLAVGNALVVSEVGWSIWILRR